MKTEVEMWCRHQKQLGIMLSEDSVFQVARNERNGNAQK